MFCQLFGKQNWYKKKIYKLSVPFQLDLFFYMKVKGQTPTAVHKCLGQREQRIKHSGCRFGDFYLSKNHFSG